MPDVAPTACVRPEACLAVADVDPTNAATGTSWYPIIKAGVEWTTAFALTIVTSPLMGGLIVLLWITSPGPAIYSQVRLGRFGKPFRIYKLRTMTHRCEAATGPVWSIAADPRVTPVGRWLRDTHLDELPQLWNVLRGEMSLIGPRPERPELAAKIETALPTFRERLAVRPGITGLAQMRMPADADLHTVSIKLAHDLQYIRKLGPSLDARIAVSTVLHFMGAAATKLSRRLVQRFAPPAPPPPTGALPELSLTYSEHVAKLMSPPKAEAA